MADYKFVNPSLENEINNIIIPSMFPVLNSFDKNTLAKYIIRLLNVVALTCGFEGETYIVQLKQNNYQDIKLLITHLLTFMNDY